MKWEKDSRMSSYKINAIVLGGTNVKEKDRLLRVFSLEQGKLTLSLKGVRQEKSKLKIAKEIFCFGQFICEKGREIDIVTGFDVIDNFSGLTKDIEKYYEGCAILDLLNAVASGANPPLFIEVIFALKTLCYENLPKYYIIDKFLLSMIDALGYSFLTENCSSCQARLTKRYLNLDIGEIVCPSCRNQNCVAISEACYSAMKLLSSSSYEKLNTIKLGGDGEKEAYNILSKDFYYRTGHQVLSII